MSKIDLERKAALILKGVAFALALILIRIFYLSVYEHDTLVEQAKKPMQRVVFENAKRGTIRDRFNLPLAINKINYQAAVVYSAIQALPHVVFEKDAQGNKVKRYFRREYIEKLSVLMGKILGEDAEKIEDLIWSTASFYGQTPFVIKDGISEETYYKLLGLARLWPGIAPQINAKRFYPEGKLASDLLGYMGAINRTEYNQVFAEIHQLQAQLEAYRAGEVVENPFQIEKRLELLQEKAYSVTDFVGKTGIEKKFEEHLRGSFGKRMYEADAKGNFIRSIETVKEPKNGERLLLTISKDLQEYAEQLLAFQELVRDERELHAKQNQENVNDLKAPWIKGGAIVAMDPQTGEVLALASYPRFDPNDFIPNGKPDRAYKINQWLETEGHIRNLWQEAVPLEREFFNPIEGAWRTERKYLSWKEFLWSIYQTESVPFKVMREIKTLKNAYNTLKNPSTLPASLDLYQKNLILDLLGLLIDRDRFPESLLNEVGDVTLDEYKYACCQFDALKKEVKTIYRQLFHEQVFMPWRKEEGRKFLKKIRGEEKEAKQWAKPYIYYFDKEEKRQFDEFWEKEGEALIVEEAKGQSRDYLRSMRSFDDLTKPLLGTYKQLRYPNEKGLAMAFYPRYGFGYGRSYAFRQAALQGSIFKVVTAFAGLNQKYQDLSLYKDHITKSDINTLEVNDHVQEISSKWYVGNWMDGTLIPQLYKGGRIPRSMNYNIGKVEAVRAMELSSNLYFSLLVSQLPSEEVLLNAMRQFSYGQKTGIDLPGEISGSLPKDLHENMTGLYATAIGQHSLVVTPLQTAVMLSTIANGGKVFKPKIALYGIKGEELEEFPTEVKREVFVPKPVRDLILAGLKKVTLHTRPQDLKRYYGPYQKALDNYGKIQKDMTTKTSTSEAIEQLGLGTGQAPFQLCHTWCGSIAFQGEEDGDVFLAKDSFGKPELVVVVYLKYGRLGKETYPLAALLAQKWREIKEKYVYMDTH